MKINKYIETVNKVINNCIKSTGYEILKCKSPVFNLEVKHFKYIITEQDKEKYMNEIKIIFNRELEFDNERLERETKTINQLILDNFKIGTEEEKNRQMFLNILLR